MIRILYIILGVSMALSGLNIIVRPAFFHSGYFYYFDFSEVKWLFGGALITIGLLFIYSSFKTKEKRYEQLMMCPKCVKPFNKKDCPGLACPECQEALEELEGFYERHPELKDQE